MKQHILITEGICGGKPRIAGHRIRVQDIVVMYEYMGMEPDEIVYHYPSLTLADVHVALAYYYENREEIGQQIREEEEFAQEMRSKTPSLVRQKFMKRNARKDPVSSR